MRENVRLGCLGLLSESENGVFWSFFLKKNCKSSWRRGLIDGRDLIDILPENLRGFLKYPAFKPSIEFRDINWV